MEQRERALAHPLRRAMLEALGVHTATSEDLRDELPDDPPKSVVAYHLHVLERAGFITVDGDGYRRA